MEGNTLTASAGTWTANPTSYAYQWQDCDPSGASCSPIGGAVTASYRLAAGDVGHTLRVAVTASNPGGHDEATSSATETVVPLAPTNTALPAISGSAMEGKTLKASRGTWTGSPTSYAYQWEDCVALSEGCLGIGGATASSYKLTAGDVNSTVRVVVTAGNAGGSTSATSDRTPIVGAESPLPPASTEPPEISGTAEEGQTLSASSGTWTNSPTSYAYQWEDCGASGEGCSTIGGATANTRVLAPSDVAHTVRVVVKATNAGGTGEAVSRATSVVTAEEEPEKGVPRHCFENPEYEGTKRITKCGYPTSENVGVEASVEEGGMGKKCSELPASGSIATAKAGETIEDKNITGTITVSNENVTVKDVCANASGFSSVLNLECGEAKGFKVEDSNIYGSSIIKNGQGEGGPSNFAINNDCKWGGSGGQLGVARKDVLYNCSSCIHGNWEATESYVLANAGSITMDASGPLNEGWHNEAAYINSYEGEGGVAIYKDDTLFTPGAGVAIVFGDVNTGAGGEPCYDKIKISDSFMAGSGTMLQMCGQRATDKGTGEISVTGSRFARCLGTKGYYETAQGKRCEIDQAWRTQAVAEASALGVSIEGSDAEIFGEEYGYFPEGDANSGGLIGCAPECPEGAAFAWEGNFWDNNLKKVSEK